MAVYDSDTVDVTGAGAWTTFYEFEQPGCSAYGVFVFQNSAGAALSDFRLRLDAESDGSVILSHPSLGDVKATEKYGAMAVGEEHSILIPIPKGKTLFQGKSAGTATMKTWAVELPKDSFAGPVLDGLLQVSDSQSAVPVSTPIYRGVFAVNSAADVVLSDATVPGFSGRSYINIQVQGAASGIVVARAATTVAGTLGLILDAAPSAGRAGGIFDERIDKDAPYVGDMSMRALVAPVNVLVEVF